MTRTYRCLAIVSVLVLAAGCGNKNKDDQTQNPDEVSADGEGSEGAESGATASRARGSTATRGAGRGTKARKVTAKKPPRVEPVPGEEDTPDEETGPNGLFASAYALPADQVFPENIADLGDPSETFEVPNLDFDEIEIGEGFPGSVALKDNYVISFNGSINVVEAAEYELCLHSDDGSQLLLEGMLVVDNGGIHDEAVEACELLYLEPGEYMLEVDYMQATGPMSTMHFAWSINGGDKVIVPSEVLFKPVDPAADPTAGS